MTDSKETELKPCPCCGGFASLHFNATVFRGQTYEGHKGNTGHRVECEADCHLMTCWWHTREEAITAWNTRTPDTAQQEAQIENQAGIMSVLNGDLHESQECNRQLLKEKKELANTINDLLRAYEQSRSETFREGVDGISLMRVRTKEARAILDRLSQPQEQNRLARYAGTRKPGSIVKSAQFIEPEQKEEQP